MNNPGLTQQEYARRAFIVVARHIERFEARFLNGAPSARFRNRLQQIYHESQNPSMGWGGPTQKIIDDLRQLAGEIAYQTEFSAEVNQF